VRRKQKEVRGFQVAAKRGNALCCLIEGDEGGDGVTERDLWFFQREGSLMWSAGSVGEGRTDRGEEKENAMAGLGWSGENGDGEESEGLW
jgi:hypothetical protein